MSKVKADRFRVMAAECERQAELAHGEEEFREIQQKLARSYLALAETEDQLDDTSTNKGPVPVAEDRHVEAA